MAVPTLDDIKLKQHLIQQLKYQETDASIKVDWIKNLVKEDESAIVIVAAEAPDLVNVMLQSVDLSERLKFIQTRAGGFNGLYNIALFHHETYRQILQSISSDDERLQLLQMKDQRGRTVLNRAAAYSAKEERVLRTAADGTFTMENMDRAAALFATDGLDSWAANFMNAEEIHWEAEYVGTVQVILESVNEEMRCKLLSMEDNNKSTPIQRACRQRNSEVLKAMMRLITVEETRYELLQLPDKDGLTPLHRLAALDEPAAALDEQAAALDEQAAALDEQAAADSAKEKVQAILESVNEERRYTLLSMEDNAKLTPL